MPNLSFNPLDSNGNYSATSNNTKLVHWPLTGGCYIWYSEEGPGRAAATPSLLLAVPNVTAQSSTTSVPITILLYDGPLLCDFNVAIKGLSTGTHFLSNRQDNAPALPCRGLLWIQSSSKVSPMEIFLITVHVK